MILSVQYMRAIAALLVVLHHAAWKGKQYSVDPMYWFKIGGVGVDLFFIISGYVMCHATYGKNINIICFMRARLIRILPTYWILTLAALCVYLIMPERINSSGGNISIFDSFTLLPTNSKYLIENGWTLSYEFYFYIIFSAGLIFSGLLKYVIPILIILSLTSTGKFLDLNGVYFNFFTNSVLIEFVMGIMVFAMGSAVYISKHASFALLIASVSMLIYVNASGTLGVAILDHGFPCLLFFIAMLNFESDFNRLNNGFLSRMASAVGDSSYSLYLIHPFILVLSSMILLKLGLTEHGYLFVMLLVVSSVLSGLACYAFLERPVTKMIKRIVA